MVGERSLAVIRRATEVGWTIAVTLGSWLLLLNWLPLFAALRAL